MRTEGLPAELARRRRLAVQRVHEGSTTEEVADFLGVAPRSVRRWLAAFRQRGTTGPEARPVPGRPPKLTRTQEKIVLRWLADSPTEHGFITELWSCPRLAQLIAAEWDVGLNPRYLSAWLRRRGITPQRPRRLPRERDERAIADWLARGWPRIKKARRRGASLALVDESGLLMAPLVRRSPAPRGRPPALRHRAGHREKVSVAAAVWLTPRRDRLGLFAHTLANGYFDGAAVAAFLRALRGEVGGPLVVVWDRGPMHKGDPIREAVAESRGRLSLEPLPPYAPELMPVEQLWAWLKYGRLADFAPRGARHLEAVVGRELAATWSDQEKLKNFFHASELPLPRTLLF